jgi:hypothetical protein
MGLSISGGCMEYRRLSPKETKLLETLIKRAGLSNILVDWRGVFVKPMADGGMGSLYLYPPEVPKEGRVFGRQASDVQFYDQDGTTVIASLYLDTNDQLFELDVWKVDFSPLKSLPENFD